MITSRSRLGGAAGSLVLRRMDWRGHKRGLVRAKKHGTKSGSGAPLRRGFSLAIFGGNGRTSMAGTSPSEHTAQTPANFFGQRVPA